MATVSGTREDLDRYLKSEGFKVFRGAMNLLQEPCEMVFHTVAGSHALNGTKKMSKVVAIFDHHFDSSTNLWMLNIN